MKVRVLGFNWSFNGTGSFAELRTILEAESKRRMALLQNALETGKLGEWDGMLFALSDCGQHWLGVVLKVKDQTRFCQVSKQEGKITLSAKELEDGSKLVEVNFFLLDPTTGNGIYQYYHHSTWVEAFGHLCAKVVSAHILHLYHALGDRAEAQMWDEKRLRAERNAVTWSLVHEVVVRQEGFSTLVDSLSHIRNVTVRFRDDNIGVRHMGALSQDANRVALVFGYDKETKVDRLKKGIKDVVSKKNPWRVRVEGETADGRFEIINLVSNKEAFDELDFDEAAQGMQIDLLNPAAMLEGSAMVKRLIGTAATPRVAKMLNPKAYVASPVGTST
ncbi:hypothetical protein [Opitutus terrae]|uniref:Uncharacterized protein n=1 Tax=Opitutus terrae (strain DSM 11246 / JCM 15787 / PB90-1) TaxID=452637 RepID=B1ZNN2_OPITP|nr:hypothetical protein [Opitutus terrae]ACB74469.1 hypothetical protein Oter_1183 [Opitutus terrae PB90-1]